MYRGTLVGGFVDISVYFNKLANNFMKPLDRFFKRIKILFAILIQTGAPNENERTLVFKR